MDPLAIRNVENDLADANAVIVRHTNFKSCSDLLAWKVLLLILFVHYNDQQGVRLENGKYPTLRPFLKQT
ncbi:Uncharacterised protein [Yersinia enterocolitica]|nr:Uncharacterised protein [Yersinia enterocolitica]